MEKLASQEDVFPALGDKDDEPHKLLETRENSMVDMDLTYDVDLSFSLRERLIPLILHQNE